MPRRQTRLQAGVPLRRRDAVRTLSPHARSAVNCYGLTDLRLVDADAKADIRRISIVKFAATILVAYAGTLAAMLLLVLLNG